MDQASTGRVGGRTGLVAHREKDARPARGRWMAVVALSLGGCFSSASSSGGEVDSGAAVCQLASDCPQGMHCGADRRCVVECRESRDCDSGVCDTALGRCRAVDAGVAVDVPEARFDAAVLDGTDVPALDAPELDAGGVDALTTSDAVDIADVVDATRDEDVSVTEPDVPAPIDVPSLDVSPLDVPPLPVEDAPSADGSDDVVGTLDATSDDADDVDDAPSPQDRPPLSDVVDAGPSDGGATDAPVCELGGPTAGLWGWWRFDGDLSDASGNGRAASVASGAPTFTEGVRCGGVVVTPELPVIDLPDGRLNRATVALWIHPTGALEPRDAPIFDGWTRSENLNVGIVQRAGEPLRWWVAVHDNVDSRTWREEFGVASTSPPATDRWTHVALTYDGASLRMYVDGRLDAEAPQPSRTYPGEVPTLSDYRLGVDRNGTRVFRGVIDDLRIYDRALTAAEVATLAAGAVAPPRCEVPAGVSADVVAAPDGRRMTLGPRADLHESAWRRGYPGVFARGGALWLAEGTTNCGWGVRTTRFTGAASGAPADVDTRCERTSGSPVGTSLAVSGEETGLCFVTHASEYGVRCGRYAAGPGTWTQTEDLGNNRLFSLVGGPSGFAGVQREISSNAETLQVFNASMRRDRAVPLSASMTTHEALVGDAAGWWLLRRTYPGAGASTPARVSLGHVEGAELGLIDLPALSEPLTSQASLRGRPDDGGLRFAFAPGQGLWLGRAALPGMLNARRVDDAGGPGEVFIEPWEGGDLVLRAADRGVLLYRLDCAGRRLEEPAVVAPAGEYPWGLAVVSADRGAWVVTSRSVGSERARFAVRRVQLP